MDRKVYGTASRHWPLHLLAVAAIGLPLMIGASIAVASSTWGQLGGDIASLVERDESGKAVAIDLDGSRVAVGAPEHDDSKGTVRIYDWDGSSWTQVGNNIDGEAAGDQSGTAVSLSSDGSRVAIGAVYNDGVNGTDSGHVRVYEYSSGSWSQLGLDIDGEAAGDEMGWAVSLSANGSRVAIGAPFNDGGGENSGHVRVYDWNGSSWIKVGSDIDGEAAADRSGHRAAVSISGDGARVAIGASHNKPDNTNESGHVRVYHWDEVDGDDDGIDKWSQLGPDIDGEATDDLSGRSVSLDEEGSRVAIGAVYNDGNGANSGHVRIYDWDADSSSWIQVGVDIDGEAAGDEMGFAVSLSANGSRLAAGAALNDGNGSNSGHVRIFDWDADSSSWVQSGTDIDGDAANDVLGRAVALSTDGSRVAVGAPGNDGIAVDAGHVRVYAENLTSSPGACSPTETSYTSGSTDYTVVTFDDVGTCNWTVPDGVTSVDVLAVGGGGGGGAWVGGGGGGGGVTFSANVTVTPGGSIPVTVGAGGAGASKAPDSLTTGANGASSSFGSASPVSALGGGVGASWDAQAAGTGGSVASGGGGSKDSGTDSGTYAGGTGATSGGGDAATYQQPHPAGGGGGAGGGGADGTGSGSSWAAGAGGVGDVSDITGTSTYYGGGGGGGVHGTWSGDSLDGSVSISAGAGGTGGGGAGGAADAVVNGQDGTDGLGGGGGGGATAWNVDSSGGDGGSGVVIVRYITPCSPSTTSYTSGSTNYRVVTFDAVGTCNWTVPAGVTSVDVLAVGGGGGGGAYIGGGGGGGGVTFSPNVTVTPGGSIPVTVGAGGAGAAWSGGSGTLTSGANGASSSFGSASPVTALGGGVGASNDWQVAGTGREVVASGGGGSIEGDYVGGTGATSSGGSAATNNLPHAAGGGGGAGGGGADGTETGTGDASSGTGGAGGVGAVSDITGASTYYGGGGGGGVHGRWTGDTPGSVISAGAGGTGGGGAGGAPVSNAAVLGADGTDGLGGGGGGAATRHTNDSDGGDGGSGVVIVRYTLAMAACSPETTSYTSGSTIYTVLAFKDVGTCSWAIPSGVSKFDWLVVGGGGGGGSWHGAGGGAGGMRSSEGLGVAVDTSFTIQVGAGGAGATIPDATSTRGSSGGASRIIGSVSGVLASVLGGGGGGTGANQETDGNDGGNGGSGGGAQSANTYDGTVGSGTSGEGSNGGTGAGGGVVHPGTARVAGGGGGYGAAGGPAGEALNDVRAGNGGGGGTVSWITASVATTLGIGEVDGSDVYFAGGGAGAGDEAVSYTLGTGGLGGGGDGRLYVDGAGEDGAASTGGGGAGSSLSALDATYVGGAGGSGVVVLRYAQAAPTTTTSPPAPAPASTTTSTTTTAPTATSTTTVPLPTETPPNPADLPVGQMTSNTTVSAGAPMTVAAGGFAPNELVGIFTVTDTDIDTIAATTATNEGTVSAQITMPSDACGEVSLIAWAPGSGVGVHQTVNVTQCAASEGVSADRLPVTGDENNLAMWALLFAALGGLAALRVRAPR